MHQISNYIPILISIYKSAWILTQSCAVYYQYSLSITQYTGPTSRTQGSPSVGPSLQTRPLAHLQVRTIKTSTHSLFFPAPSPSH